MSRSESPKSKRSKQAGRLNKLRVALGMSQRAFAKEFQVTQGAIAHWEAGERTIPGPVLKLIEIYETQIKQK